MKKRLATMILCAAMTASILAGCKTGKESNAPADTAAGTAQGTSQDTAAADQGEEINDVVWTELGLLTAKDADSFEAE